MRTTKIITIVTLLGVISTTFTFAQKNESYKHSKKNFQFEAGENWKNVKHAEDELIYEMVDPDGGIHVMLWFTETESPAKNYIAKMADMKGYSRDSGPDKTTINKREAWMIEGGGEVYEDKVKVLIASIPVHDKSHISHANHIAQYIVQIWCPIKKYEEKREEMSEIMASIAVK